MCGIRLYPRRAKKIEDRSIMGPTKRAVGVVLGVVFLAACGTGERGLEHETTLFERTRGECEPEE